MALTNTPRSETSRASDLVNPMTPALARGVVADGLSTDLTEL